MVERRKLERNSGKKEGTLIGGKATVAKTPPESDFCTIYRPETFDDILGHEPVCRSVKEVLDTGSKRCFVFTGPAGLGKTTFSRAIANHVMGKDYKLKDYKEHNAAEYSGADDIRKLVELMRYKPMVLGEKKVYCIDEAHSLSSQAWQCLLKTAEEPPPYGYWIFCTTVQGKIPDTIMTRAATYNLDPLKSDLLYGLLEVVNADQKLGLDEDILDMIAHESDGSPRQALTNLAKCRTARDRGEAASWLQGAHENPELREMCLSLSKGNLSWDKAMKTLSGLSNLDPEGIRIQIVLYFASVVRGAKNPDAAGKAIEVMDCFLPGPLYPANKHAELYVMLAKALFR